MLLNLTILPGDGIGPEVTEEAVRVLANVAEAFGHRLRLARKNVGGAALVASNDPLPKDTIESCLSAGAVLLGAVGGPAFDSYPAGLRPEKGLLRLRKELGVFANLRPAVCFTALEGCSPLRAEVVRGTDVLIVRELLGGLYFGEPRSTQGSAGNRQAVDTMQYGEPEIERIARVAFELARGRRRKVTSVDKANVLDCSRLWRDVVTRVAQEFSDVQLAHMYVDSAAMALVSHPANFDVVLTENMFGDILSDQAGSVVGSIGMLPSASVGGTVALYEPVHGSAPDIAGRGIANPLGAILSVAMMLRHSFQLNNEAASVEAAVNAVLEKGYRTKDISSVGGRVMTTREMGEAVAAAVLEQAKAGAATSVLRHSMAIENQRTLLDKIWDEHVVCVPEGRLPLLYIDLHLVHEVTSPQAFDGLRAAGRRVRQPQRTFATVDHNIPTEPRGTPIVDPIAALQIQTLQKNCKEFGVPLCDLDSPDQGIVHVIGPELGLTQPGMTIVCGDSHTSTHGAFGALAFGIGTSEVEHVLATQCLAQRKPKSMLIEVKGKLGEGVTAKDLALGVIRQIGTDGATGFVIEYAGETVRSLSMEGRMTLCNMSIEAGARAAMIAPDDTTFAYIKERRLAPRGQAWDEAIIRWRRLSSDAGARYDRTISIDATRMAPLVTWGTNPGMVIPVDDRVPAVSDPQNGADRGAMERMLEYMGLEAGTPVEKIAVDRVFIGSCTNSRLEDLRAAARVVKGYRVSPKVRAMVVPGSQTVKRAAEQEGLHRVFQEAGFEWRESGCSMCLGMNPDILQPGERCASTSNRNFEGRQGRGGRTHLVSPMMAAAAAIAGHFTDVRKWRFQ